MIERICKCAVLALLTGVLLLSACSGPEESDRPRVYRGGQSYEDAVHR